MQYFWRLNDSTRVETEEAVEISRFWFGLPVTLPRVDAVYERTKDRLIVLFSGLFH